MTTFGEQDTIAAIATPPGRGGIAIVRVSGPLSEPIVRTIIGRPDAPLPDRTMVYTTIRDNDGRIDEALICAMYGPHSYTGEDVVEIQCHGGNAVARAIITLLARHGIRQALPGEYSRRAFENGRIDLVQAESIMEVVDAESREHLRRAEQLMNGAFSRELDALLHHITHSLSLLELNIEFLSQGLEPIHERELRSAITGAIHTIEHMISSYAAARRIRNGINIVLAGDVNAGKSSLFNYLLGRHRAIVSETAGTTRDWIEERIELDGIPLNLIDTAGLRFSTDTIEQEGISESERLIREADIILHLSESTHSTLNTTEGTPEIIAIHTKADIYPTDDPNILSISTTNGLGIDTLKGNILTIARRLMESQSSDTFVIIERHRAGLHSARTSLEHAYNSIDHWSEEVTALELHEAQHHIESLLGKSIDLAVLDTIFSSFCIGK